MTGITIAGQKKDNTKQSGFSVSHKWITVVNPYSKLSLLQACDDCGVVKSQNSINKSCKANKGVGLISSALLANINIAV